MPGSKKCIKEYDQVSKSVEILYRLVATARFKTEAVEHSTEEMSGGGGTTQFDSLF